RMSTRFRSDSAIVSASGLGLLSEIIGRCTEHQLVDRARCAIPQCLPECQYNYDMSLESRVAVVTGATKGVGRGIAQELALQRARVFLTGRSAPDHNRIDERITGIRCDHRVESQVVKAFSLILRESNSIDILVNNIWGGYEGMVEQGVFTWS